MNRIRFRPQVEQLEDVCPPSSLSAWQIDRDRDSTTLLAVAALLANRQHGFGPAGPILHDCPSNELAVQFSELKDTVEYADHYITHYDLDDKTDDLNLCTGPAYPQLHVEVAGDSGQAWCGWSTRDGNWGIHYFAPGDYTVVTHDAIIPNYVYLVEAGAFSLGPPPGQLPRRERDNNGVRFDLHPDAYDGIFIDNSNTATNNLARRAFFLGVTVRSAGDLMQKINELYRATGEPLKLLFIASGQLVDGETSFNMGQNSFFGRFRGQPDNIPLFQRVAGEIDTLTIYANYSGVIYNGWPLQRIYDAVQGVPGNICGFDGQVKFVRGNPPYAVVPSGVHVNCYPDRP